MVQCDALWWNQIWLSFLQGDTYVPKDTTAIRQAARKAARLQDGLFSWHEVGDENPRVVILQHMFHPDDFAEVPFSFSHSLVPSHTPCDIALNNGAEALRRAAENKGTGHIWKMTDANRAGVICVMGWTSNLNDEMQCIHQEGYRVVFGREVEKPTPLLRGGHKKTYFGSELDGYWWVFAPINGLQWLILGYDITPGRILSKVKKKG